MNFLDSPRLPMTVTYIYNFKEEEGIPKILFFLRIQVIHPQKNNEIQFEILASKGSLEAFFSLCSQDVFR